MPDVFSEEKRSWVMGRVKGRDTSPERAVRSIIHSHGYRFRLHGKDLPGKPDIVLPRHKKVILVNGCFWHGHKGCARAKRPDTNADFWNAKIDANMQRDVRNVRKLRRLGWSVMTVWSCELRKPEKLERRLLRFLSSSVHKTGVSSDSS